MIYKMIRLSNCSVIFLALLGEVKCVLSLDYFGADDVIIKSD